jgi:polysaccharide export outer membrane protein
VGGGAARVGGLRASFGWRGTRLAVALIGLAGVAVMVAVGGLAVAQEYEIGAGDLLHIEVAGRPEMTDDFRVDAGGLINYWEVGKVMAAGHTPSDLERKLTTLLIAGQFMRRPQVKVVVSEYASQKVYVAGEVQRQGYYALKADRSLRGFLSDVPFGPDAGHEVIVIRPGAGTARAAEEEGAATGSSPSKADKAPEKSKDEEKGETGGKEEKEQAEPSPTPPPPIEIPGLPPIDPSNEVTRVNLLELQVGAPEQEIILQAGDTVFVPRAAQVYVLGAVSRPGAFRYEPGMTVLQALTLAGGVTARGSEGRTKVIRIVEGKKTEEKVKLTDVLQPEDRLEVPERFF